MEPRKYVCDFKKALQNGCCYWFLMFVGYAPRMNSSHDYKNYIENDLLGFVDGITSKRMFGWWGFYLYGFIFAFIVEDELYFKTSPEIESEFASRGSEPFVYTGHTSKWPVKMPYWKLPIEIQEDRELLEEWIRRSAEISKKK